MKLSYKKLWVMLVERDLKKTEFAKNAKILQFDVDAAEINKNIHTDASVIGDALEILKRVNAKLEQLEHTEWLEHLKEYEETNWCISVKPKSGKHTI